MGVEDVKSIFSYMLQSGLCDEKDWPHAKELVRDWLNIYKETLAQEGEYFYGDNQIVGVVCS